jgi:hypothetical protein
MSDENVAEIWAKADDDLAYAQDIVTKASAQLEKVITRRKIAEANIMALVSKEAPLKLLPLLDGRFVLVEHNGYRGEIKVITAERYQAQKTEEIWEHT